MKKIPKRQKKKASKASTWNPLTTKQNSCTIKERRISLATKKHLKMNLEYLNFENYLENLGDSIGYYITIIIVPIGILLNLKTAFLFSRKSLNKTNMGFFYFWTSVLFMFTLAYSVFFIKSKLFFNYDRFYQTTTLFNKAIRSMPPWLLVITIERYVSLKYNNKINKNNKKIFFFVFLFISASLFAVNVSSIYLGLTYSFSNNTNNSVQPVVAKIKCTATNDVSNISEMIAGVFRLINPSLLIIIFVFGRQVIFNTPGYYIKDLR